MPEQLCGKYLPHSLRPLPKVAVQLVNSRPACQPFSSAGVVSCAHAARRHPRTLRRPTTRQLLQVGGKPGCGPEEDEDRPAPTKLLVLDIFAHRAQSCKDGILVRICGRLDQSHWCVSGSTMFQKRVANQVQGSKTHVEHRCLLHGTPSQLSPVKIRECPGLALANAEVDMVGAEASMGQRNLARGCRAQRGRDAWDDLHGNLMLHQEFKLLPTSPEYKWISTFQTDDPVTASAMKQHQLMDFLLLQTSVFHVPAALADIYQLRTSRHEVQHLL
mmetsp:Transcript_19545/g.31257  ORF Transcript_19545/g.31257 Transcript_19545/m.31257 type:complete len:274 (-) Transcript_19545:327-1148(-)